MEKNLSSIWQSWLERAYEAVNSHAADLNAMNVFPVPDSDTGSNMAATLAAAAAEDDPLTSATAALKQARGNSGTLLSVWLKAFVRSMGADGLLTPEALHMGLWVAYQEALAAMSHPEEGTILTAMEAVARAEIAGDMPQHLLFLAESACLAAHETGFLLQAAARAQTLDAGAVGFALVINALSLAYSGQGMAAEHLSALFIKPVTAHSNVSEEGVEIMCELALDAADMAALRSSLDAVGTSLSVARAGADSKGQPVWAVHVHVASAQLALDAIAQYGRANNLRITSLADGKDLH